MFWAEAIDDDAEPCGRCILCRLSAAILAGQQGLEMTTEADSEEAIAALRAAVDEGIAILADLLFGDDDNLEDYAVGDIIRVTLPEALPTRH